MSIERKRESCIYFNKYLLYKVSLIYRIDDTELLMVRKKKVSVCMHKVNKCVRIRFVGCMVKVRSGFGG